MNQQDYSDAARAAGYEIYFEGDNAWINGDYMAVTNTSPWCPLASDLHAFRLMVDAGITIDLNSEGIEASYETDFYIAFEEWASYNNDKHAATRAAIFQAAVAKGKAMREAK